MCGQLAGAIYGRSAVPAPLLDQLRTWDHDEAALRALLLWDAAHDPPAKKESLKRPRDE